MRKSSLFISAALTTFVLVILAGVASAYAYQTAMKSSLSVVKPADVQPAAEQLNPSPAVSAPTELPAAAQSSLTPEQAANMAAQVLGRTDLFSAELSSWNGAPAFLITFTNGDLVYVGMDGQILSVSQAPVFVTNSTSGGNGGGAAGSGRSGNDHESHGETESHEGDD